MATAKKRQFETAKAPGYTPALPNPESKWSRGVALALEMLAESTLEEMALDPGWRAGRRQDNAVYRYLLRAREAGPKVEVAFCSLLCEYIASSELHGCPDLELLEKLARKPVPQRATSMRS
jgi:hypothetical protein